MVVTINSTKRLNNNGYMNLEIGNNWWNFGDGKEIRGWEEEKWWDEVALASSEMQGEPEHELFSEDGKNTVVFIFCHLRQYFPTTGIEWLEVKYFCNFRRWSCPLVERRRGRFTSEECSPLKPKPVLPVYKTFMTADLLFPFLCLVFIFL